MRLIRQLTGSLLLLLSCTTQAQEISFMALGGGSATPGLGELVYDAASDRLYIATGSTEIRVIDTSGALDAAFGTDGIIGNDVGEAVLLDAEYIAVSGNRIFVSDQALGQVLVLNAATGALDTSLATDGIIGNDAVNEPDFTGLTLHDIEILNGELYIATNTNVVRYRLDGSDNNATFSAFAAQTLTIGPLASSGNCSTLPVDGSSLLYAMTPNGAMMSEQGTVACIDATGAATTLAQTGDLSLTDMVFAPPAGDSCVVQSPFADGSILYIASRRFDTELRCMGADGGSGVVNDATIGASTGITVANLMLFIREVGDTGTIYQSEILNQIPTVVSQTLAIDENTPAPTLVTTVVGNDLDPGDMLGDWMIASGNVSLDGDGDLPFVIDPVSAEIRINDSGDINRELTANFDLMVTVSDGLSTSAPTSILVSLNDLNEFTPAIDALADQTIDENLANAMPVTTATAQDGDATAMLQDWTITGGNTSTDGDGDLPFAIDPDSGLITVNDSGDLDREVISGFALTLTVSDGTFTSAPQTQVIDLNDINEFTPVAVGQTLAIDENPTDGSPLTMVMGSDGDATGMLQDWTITAGNNSVDGDGDLPFMIDPGSGLITINDAGDIDRELIDAFTLMVTVSDGMLVSQAVTVQVDINDINKFPPVISAVTPLTIDENPAAMSLLFSPVATDDDATAQLQDWTIASGNISLDGDGDLPFAIDPDTGEISVSDAGDFDRELTTDFNLTITVSDGDNTSDAVPVQLTLTDVNEFDPVIDDPGQILLNKGNANGTPVVTLTGSDEDATDSISDWLIVSGNADLDQDGNPPFMLDPMTGLITVNDNDDLDIQQLAVVVLNVTVSDGTRTSAEQPIAIELTPETSFVIANNDSYGITEGNTAIITASGVLDNDEEENGEDLMVDQVNGGANLGVPLTLDLGLQITLDADGALMIDATGVTAVAEGDSTDVTFSYRATNGSDDDIATVVIAVSGLNDAPVAQDDLFNLNEDETLTASVLDDNGNGADVDPDTGQPLTITNAGIITGSGIGGTVDLSADGSFSYQPPADTSGMDMFDYTLSDGSISDMATVVIDVLQINDAPSFIAGPDQFLPAGSTGMQTVPNWASAIDAGANEGSQNLTFTVTPTSDPDAVVSAIDIASDGTLSYTLSGNIGLATFDVQLFDDGGTANGGVDRSAVSPLVISSQNGVEIRATITDNQITAEDGEMVVYTMVISNMGPEDAIGVSINNVLPVALSSATWTCAASSGAACTANGVGGVVDSADLPLGGEVSYTLSATVSGANGEQVLMTVDAQPVIPADDIVPANNTASDLTIIGALLFMDGFEDIP